MQDDRRKLRLLRFSAKVAQQVGAGPGLEGGLSNSQLHTCSCPPPGIAGRQPLLTASQGLGSTHRVQEHGQEELASIDDLVQLTGATRVLVVEDGVCEEAAGLPREDLGMGRERSYGFSRSAWWQAGCVLREAAFCVTTRPPPLGVFPTKERLPPVTVPQVSPPSLARLHT